MDCDERKSGKQPHVVCVPLPLQSHANAMLSVAKLLHQRGFYITFVMTEYTHKRIIKCRGPNSLDGILNFQFKSLSDFMTVEASDIDKPQDLASLCFSISKDFSAPLSCLLSQLNLASSQNNAIPPVTCIVADGCMSPSVRVAMEFNIPVTQFWPVSSCSLLGLLHFGELISRGVVPFQDEDYLRNGYLESTVDWIPGMKNIRLKDLPSFIRTTDPNDIFLNFFIEQTKLTQKASAIILNTFEALDQELLDALSTLLIPPVYTIGPLHLFSKQIKDKMQEAICLNLWEEKSECICWLDSKEPNSVLYVNFGSLAVITLHQLTEFAWGLANCREPFLWILRPDIVKESEDDDYSVAAQTLLCDFLEETKERGMIASWCCQEQVLKHSSVKAFLTHNGWNSTMESICAGVPMISWPYFGDQQTTCRYCCVEWGIALEIENDVTRDKVESCIKEVMEGKKGKEMKAKIIELKNKAEESYSPGASSYLNFDKLITQVLLSPCYHEVK